MRNIMFKIFIMIIIIVIMLYIHAPYIYADNWSDLISGAQSESGNIPPDPPPSDVEVNPIPNPPVSTVPVEYKYYYTSIKGNVYENMGPVYVEGKNITNDVIGRLGVKDVTVIAERTSNLHDKNESRWKLQLY